MEPTLLPIYYGLGIVLWFYLLAAIASHTSPFYRSQLKHNDKAHIQHLDGLRGLLAISIFVNHFACYYMYYFHGVWKTPDHGYYLYIR